ncbi:MAG: hypothetical protein FWF72_02230 [Paludibacter sp.]|nr:hypothetical protein [Paludibacter sp.]
MKSKVNKYLIFSGITLMIIAATVFLLIKDNYRRAWLDVMTTVKTGEGEWDFSITKTEITVAKAKKIINSDKTNWVKNKDCKNDVLKVRYENIVTNQAISW